MMSSHHTLITGTITTLKDPHSPFLRLIYPPTQIMAHYRR